MSVPPSGADAWMIILFGETEKLTVCNKGSFYCAICDASQAYERIEIRSYGTVLFIPFIPLGKKADYVECLACRATYAPDILKQPEQTADDCPTATSHLGMVRVLAYLLLGYGKTTARVGIVQEIYQDMTKQPLTESCIRQEVHAIEHSEADILTIISQIAQSMSYAARTKTMVAAFRLTRACSDMAYEDRLRLNQMSSRFEIRLDYEA